MTAALALLLTAAVAPADGPTPLAARAQAVLDRHCHRCHGQDGSVEGGFNYVLDRDKLVARRKVVPGRADESPLFRKITSGKMPPPDVSPRPSADEIAVLRAWIDGGAARNAPIVTRPFLTEDDVARLILADLDARDRRARRFQRYFSLVELANAGLGEDELQTYRNALAKLLNSLSWHPRTSLPRPIDPGRLVLRIDLRDFAWDASFWNRLLTEYPYGILSDSVAARAMSVATATRLPCLRADWFLANASRPPLYHDLLQLPTNAAELETQLRVNVAADIQQERVARAGFNGSGISRNNRVLERHDAVHGAYWRTYDFDAVPQSLAERDLLALDRRNIFAYPLGPNAGDRSFQHLGGEIIFNLPNGLQGYLIVNANNQRIDRAPTNVVSDPKRPDRAVENGVSCMGCHYRGINPKDDQVRDHVTRNPKVFARSEAELVRALYVPAERMRALMEEDAERFRKALEKTGNKVSAAEPVITLTLRYEADVDLPTAAAELGLREAALRDGLARSEAAARSLGALRVPGGTVARTVFVQAFPEVVRSLRPVRTFDPAAAAIALPDNTGELDPLEVHSSVANGLAFTPDGSFALIAGRDRTLRIHDLDAGRDRRRGIGHTASVWGVACSPDGRQALTGGADGTVRLWDVATGRELRRLDGHFGVVTAVAFSPDGRQALSGGEDDTVCLWGLDTGQAMRRWEGAVRRTQAVAFAPDGRTVVVAAGQALHLWEIDSGREVGRLEGHTDNVTCVAFSADGRGLLSGGDDGALRLWDVANRRPARLFRGHEGPVNGVTFAADGRRAVSGGSDGTVRLWDVAKGVEESRFNFAGDSVITVALDAGQRHVLAGRRDGRVRLWEWTERLPRPAIRP